MDLNISNLAAQGGGGMIVGAVIGFAAKKILKIVALLAGIQTAVLTYLEQKGLITVNWEAFQNMALVTAGDGGGMPPFLANTISSILLGGGLALGAAVGFRKG